MNNNIRILMVDDEFLALKLLEDYTSRLPGLEVVATTKSVTEAMDILAKEQIDLLFLDIQMPILSGVNLFKSLQKKPLAIFTTAYAEYAVEAFDLNAVDYLLKPYGFERFVQAINKVRETLSPKAEPASESSFIVVKVEGRLQKVLLKDLLYVEGLKEYVKLVCSGKQYVTFERLKNIAEMLPAADFVRVHKSFIVAKQAVQSLEGNQLDLGKVKIPISREKKEEILAAIFGGTY
jgi:two-component system, LytTR family, response regulator LytT